MIPRRAAKVDHTQKSIVDALRRIGVSVEIISKPVDLLVCHRGVTSLMEVKTPRPTSEGGKHGFTKEQVEFIARWPGTVFVVHSAEEAVNAVLGIKEVSA